MIALKYLHEILDYDPTTGVFRWRVNRRHMKAGSVAGHLDKKSGYWRIRTGGRNYSAHRLAWFYMTGEWPESQIDHRDLNKTNNRWSNLREATNVENSANKPCRNKHGLKGIHMHRDGRFVAAIKVHGKRYHLGIYDTPADAHAAYMRAANDAFGEFARAS